MKKLRLLWRCQIAIVTVIFLEMGLLPVCCYGSAQHIYRENSKSTVVITNYDAKGKPIKLGSGFIVSSDGRTVTNYHVISDARTIGVRVDGKEFTAEGLLHVDKANDLALLKINGRNFSPVRIGNAENLTVGSRVYVISSPRGLENSLSEGLISAVRTMGSQKVVQITAPISPGSSGGPVFNESGEVIAVATYILKESQNVNFAIPISVIADKIAVKRAIMKKEVPAEDYSRTAEYWLNRCRAYAASDLGEDGINACDKALVINPSLAEAHLIKGILYLSLYEVSEAISNCTKAIQLTEDEALLTSAHSVRAMSYMFLGRYPYALSDSTYALKLIQEKPENAMLVYWARMAHGGSHVMAGNFNQAISDFDAVMKFRDDIAAEWLGVTYQYRGHAYFRSGRYREAIDNYNQNIALYPERLPDVYRNLGLSHYYLGRKDLALENLQIAARLGDSDAQNSLRS
ncbi:MAG: trypsin-like peptidase domain-containing protein [Candidatus Omnitrophica bacterium]|nr:trypsin-like peptidase domain-containing protein [Candidatus Omnitrophota bacterium]